MSSPSSEPFTPTGSSSPWTTSSSSSSSSFDSAFDGGVRSCSEAELKAVKERLNYMVSQDDVKMFLKTTSEYDSLQLRREGQALLARACEYKAFGCVSALLSGKTSLIFNVNEPPDNCKEFPLHYVAHHRSPGMIELLLYHGASADVRCKFYENDPMTYLPLHCALTRMRILLSYGRYKECKWIPGDSVFKLVTLICFKKFQVALECVELLAYRTSTFQDEFLRYAREGELEFLASLLAVARKNLTLSIEEIRKLLSSCSSEPVIPEDKKADVYLLLDVFDKAGELLEACIRKNKNDVTTMQTHLEVAELLNLAGFCGETGSSSLLCTLADGYSRLDESTGFRSADVDVGMDHYGQSQHRWSLYNTEGDDLFKVESLLDLSILRDDPKLFCRTINKYPILRNGQSCLLDSIDSEAYNCVSILLSGQTPLSLNVNKLVYWGLNPIHWAVRNCSPGMIELLLFHRASPNVRCQCYESDYRFYLPLHAALDSASGDFGINEWVSGDSIFNLVILICLPRNQKKLECVELLAAHTKDIEAEFFRYAKKGKISFLAPLLAVAHKRLTSTSGAIRTSFSSQKQYLTSYEKRSVLLLLDVFERAGDAIETYIKRNRNGVSVERTSQDVKCLLENAGFKVDPDDVDLSNLSCYNKYKKWSEEMFADDCKTEDDYFQMVDSDTGMEHYDSTKLRWKLYNKSSNGREQSTSLWRKLCSKSCNGRGQVLKKTPIPSHLDLQVEVDQASPF